MYRFFLPLFFGLIIIFPQITFAQDQQSACISTHFHHFYGPSDTVKVVSVERLKRWSTWCKHGYSAKKLEEAIQPCYQDTINTMRSQNDGYVAMNFTKTREIKAQCTQKLWTKISSTENSNES